MNNTVRPTKKQREILVYIEKFIGEHGYSPSYREIMNGLDYTSVATVSLHVNSLIRRGHLRKRDRSARSLEVVASNLLGSPRAADIASPDSATPNAAQSLSWLASQTETRIAELETLAAEPVDAVRRAAAAQLLAALEVLRYPGAGELSARLAALPVHDQAQAEAP